MEVNFNSYQQETQGFDRLIKSLPEEEKEALSNEMDNVSDNYVTHLINLMNENKPVHSICGDEARKIITIALKALKKGLISLNQMATLHIVDAAIRDFTTHSSSFVSSHTINNGKFQRNVQIIPIHENMISYEVQSFHYLQSFIPVGDPPSDFPKPFSNICLINFFNLNTKEWERFCKKIKKVVPSEQQFLSFNVPEVDSTSLLIDRIQKLLKMCHYINIHEKRGEGIQLIKKKMLVPSFSMFQAALKVKAKTLGRRAVKLIPTYYLLEKQDYAETKEKVGIPFALYFPEANKSVRYEQTNPRFKAEIDGYPHEGPFAALIHDFYHALRELMMTENIAKARYELAKIARNHRDDTTNENSKAISDILVDGELIHCYPPELDTVFEPNHEKSQIFGDLFYDTTIQPNLHPALKEAFLYDMASRKEFWKKEFNLVRSMLHLPERMLYDKCLLSIADHNIRQAEIKYYTSPGKSLCGSTSWDLIVAAVKGEYTLKKFLTQGIEIDTEEENVDRALFFAILRNEKAAVKLLLEYKSSPSKPFISNETPLKLACEYGYEEIVILLLQAGASLDIKNCNGQTPMDIAKANGHTSIVELLEKSMKT